MSVLSSPSPTLSPRPSFSSHDRSIAHLRRSTSRSYKPSPSGSQQQQQQQQQQQHQQQHHKFHSHASSPASAFQYPAPATFSTPKKRPVEEEEEEEGEEEEGPRIAATSDTGTQYTPPDYPPTSSRSMSSTNIFGGPIPRLTTQTDSAATHVEVKEATAKLATDASKDTHITPPEPSLRKDPEPHHTPTATGGSDSTPASGQASEDESSVESPLKRAKGALAVKIMPLDYMKCDIRDLGIVIADMLLELVRINDPLPFKNEQLTRYHSRAPPGISVHDYLNRLIVHATLSPPILLALVYYIDKLSALYPVFNISSLTVHRYLITAATVGAKGLSDSFWTNNTYSRVGGISVRELALLELDFLERMDWKIVPPADVLVDYYRNLVERNDHYQLEDKADIKEETAR